MPRAALHAPLWYLLVHSLLHTGLGEAIEKLSGDKVDAAGMDAYTHQMTKVCMHCQPQA